jgi:hypothetical protein
MNCLKAIKDCPLAYRLARLAGLLTPVYQSSQQGLDGGRIDPTNCVGSIGNYHCRWLVAHGQRPYGCSNENREETARGQRFRLDRFKKIWAQLRSRIRVTRAQHLIITSGHRKPRHPIVIYQGLHNLYYNLELPGLCVSV